MREESMLVKIHGTLAEGKDDYEATRGNWRINERRLPYIQYVVGVNHGKIVCAFLPKKWETIEEGGRRKKRFEGVEASVEILQKLRQKESKIVRKFKGQNPVRYLSLDELEEM
ncbi:hypothetical protein B1690_14275 [Geobacillus sp. 46C-IIa]|uniref:hypothetical protein n=2 Tax=Geobacillus sp. 46C-IIa TaxID=1963025 RepID=UPI0009BD2C85|nr:hypothetical protein [Geobacillus sp. 46C-IIa]OQP05156.1 hypothetical protein B1690_14275 [Geobacillus sp. 46C-IIa]QNU28084.1 hypothetical protein IC803_00350 [Geobacillus sp. 46C-IIa]